MMNDRQERMVTGALVGIVILALGSVIGLAGAHAAAGDWTGVLVLSLVAGAAALGALIGSRR